MGLAGFEQPGFFFGLIVPNFRAMSLIDSFRSLPIAAIVPEVRELLASQNTVILHAPPGAGKSTLLPLTLLEEKWLDGKKIVMLEPRRLAASSIAYRMSDMLERPIGHTVGYRIRFDNKVSENTRLEVVTEGILSRMIHRDNALEEVGIVIFDEFHERSIYSDLGLALCREIQQILRPDLRILIMSATLETDPLSRLLSAPVIKSEGKIYPVKIKYQGENDTRFIPEMCVQTILKAYKENTGDILVFLPGQGEIKKAAALLKEKRLDLKTHLLYGQLPHAKQQAAIRPDPSGKRKVVLATSLAETSLTIEGVQVVIDCGFTRSSRFDPNTSLTRLVTTPVSQDAADQRAGRAGRLGPGVCYRLWSKATQHQLAPFRTPEILEADLSVLVLELAKWGAKDVSQLAWLTPPPKGAVSQALELLEELGALENGKITAHGEKIYRLPCHPRISHMLLMSQSDGLETLATDIAAILEEKDPLDEASGLDINKRVEYLRRYRQRPFKRKRLEKIEKIAETYRKILQIKADNGLFDPLASGLLLAHAYPEKIASARPGNQAQFQLANGKIASMSHRDDLAHSPWIAIAQMDDREKMGKIFLAATLDPKDLKPLIRKMEKIIWDSKNGRLIAQEVWKIGQIVLQSLPLKNPDREKTKAALLSAVKSEGRQLLNFSNEVEQWQNRVLSLRRWNGALQWPDVSTETLLGNCEEWLTSYLEDIKSAEDFRRLDLLKILSYSLPYEQSLELEKLVPTSIEVPSGSRIKLEYGNHGEPPILAVRLQELFGLAETPTVNEGKVPVVIHLLSPGFKQVQVTTDLASFWNNAYHDVRKDLKRRYPKHYWPDNPREAEAVRGVKR